MGFFKRLFGGFGTPDRQPSKTSATTEPMVKSEPIKSEPSAVKAGPYPTQPGGFMSGDAENLDDLVQAAEQDDADRDTSASIRQSFGEQLEQGVVASIPRGKTHQDLG